MSSFNDWLTSTALSQVIQTTSWMIPGIQCVHIVCLATLFVTALMVTTKVLGRSWKEQTAAQVAAKFMPVIWTCLAILLVSGALLISAEPGRTLGNISFYIKITLIVIAVTLTLIINSAARRGTIGGLHRVLAVVSMLVWACIIVAGRYIAYT